eukprot:Gb_16598 [translate_table: standard]
MPSLLAEQLARRLQQMPSVVAHSEEQA